MKVQRLAPGLWRWTGHHPDWTPDQGGAEGWDQEVASGYWEAEDAIVLVDPLAPPEDGDRFFGALDSDVERVGRPVAVVLTTVSHGRSAAVLVERYGASVWLSREQADGPRFPVTNAFSFGDRLPGGIEAYEAPSFGGEALLWLPDRRALFAGDVLLGDAGGVRVCPESWQPEAVRGARFRAGLRFLLDLPIELVLPAHGEPAVENGRAALERALAT
jgi:glyoxylase-like metal-dependent hydrolase (beta-lactamase superfamily II)